MRRGNYAPRACNHCRRRKTKCDGVQPECTRCRTSGHECSWGPESARKPTTKHYVTSLQNMVEVLKRKNEHLEAQLASHRREINQQPYLDSHSANSSPLSAVGPLSDIESPERQPAALEEDPVKQEEDPDLIEQLIAPTQHLHFEDNNLRLYGPTSIFRLAPRGQAPERTSRFQQIAESQSGSYRLRYLDGSPQADIDWNRHLPQDVPLSRAEHDHILDLLFRFFTSWCLRVVPELFLHDMCRSLSTPPGQTPPKTPHYSPMLHNALLSVATAFSDDPEIKKLEARRKFAAKAKERLEEECERPNLSVICALSVLSNFHSSQGEQTLGYMYFGISARMSQALGLGFDCSPWVAKGLISEDTMHDRNFAYWTTFCQDTTWSLYVGRDFCLSSQSDRQPVRVPFVDSQLDHFIWDWPKQTPRPNYIPRTFAATCDLMQVARQILDVVSNFSRLSIQRVDDYLIGQMDLKLHTWKNNLAPEVDINKVTFATAMPHQLMLQMTYHWLCIILHRPFYRRKRSTDEKAFEVDHMKLCDRAAHEIMELAAKWHELYSLRYVPITFIQVVSAAGTIFVLSALQAVSGTRLAKAAHHHARANVEKTIQYLHEVGESFPSARVIGEILANLLREQLEARLARRAGMPHQLASLSPGGGELLQVPSPSSSLSTTSPTEEISPRLELVPPARTQEPIMRPPPPFGLHSADASFLAYGINSFNDPQASTSYPIGPFSDQSQFLSGDIDMGQNLLGAEMWMDGGDTFSNVPFMSGSPSNSPPQPSFGHTFTSEEVMLDIMNGPGVYNF